MPGFARLRGNYRTSSETYHLFQGRGCTGREVLRRSNELPLVWFASESRHEQLHALNSHSSNHDLGRLAQEGTNT